jgi:ADP-heptose:LPS heptosyltransferase
LLPSIGQRPIGPQTLRLLEALGIDPVRPYLLLAPNATWPSKEWPEARWRELALLLLREVPWPVVLLEAPGRPGDWTGVAQAIPAGRGGALAPLQLSEALAVAGAAKVLVTVDGGLMHAAVAMGTPTVALFGPTDPGIWFPYQGGGPFGVLATAPHCHPCDLHECPEFICMPELPAPSVVAEVARVLESSTDVTEGES